MSKPKRQSTDLVAIDYSQDAGAGMEGADASSFAIPFLAVLQTNSPHCDKDEGKYVKGAEPGMIFNTVTNKLYDGKTGVLVVPAAFQRRFIRWAPRDLGGGFKGEYTPEEVLRMREAQELVEQENRLYFPDEKGNVNPKRCDLMSDTRNHFVVVIDPESGTFSSALLSLGSTQIKKSKLLMSMLDAQKATNAAGHSYTLPTFASIVRMTTVPESNDQGKWHGVRFELEGRVNDQAIYAAAKHLRESVLKGRVETNYAKEAEAAEQGGGF